MNQVTDRDQKLIENRFQEAEIEWSGDPYTLLRDRRILAKAAPLLLRLLHEVSSPITKDDLVRVASSAKVSPEPFLTMLRELRPAIETGDKKAIMLGWTLGEALRKISDPSVFDDLVEIIEDPRYGTSRQMLAYALGQPRDRRDDAIRVLIGLLDDKDLTVQVIDALGGLKAAEAQTAIAPYVNSPNRYVRSYAKKALAKIAPNLEKATTPKKPKRKRLGPIPADFEEASTNFDLHGVPPFLERLTALVDGFGSAEKEAVDQLLDSMEVEEEAELEFPVVFRGEKVRLRFKLFMCDEGALDLAVFTVPALSQQIQEAMGDD